MTNVDPLHLTAEKRDKEAEKIKEALDEHLPITADAPASSLTWEQIVEERRAKTAKYRNLVMRLIRETFPYVLYEEASAFFDSTDHYESMSTKAAETRLELLGGALAGPVLMRLHDHIEDSIRALKLQEEKAETNHVWKPPADKPLVGVKPETVEEREKRLDDTFQGHSDRDDVLPETRDDANQ